MPLTAWELKVLICIHKITQEAQFARLATKKEVKNNNIWLKFWFYFMCEIKQQPYPYIWLEFKVLLEMWGTGGFVRRKFIFLYPGGNASKAICWDLAHTWSGVSMTSAVMGFWATQWAQATPRAFPLMTAAATNKNKATFFFFSYPLYHSGHYLHNSVRPSSSFLDTAPIFAHRGFRAKSISQQLILIIHNRSLQHPRRVGAADPDKLSRVNPTRSLSGSTKWSN